MAISSAPGAVSRKCKVRVERTGGLWPSLRLAALDLCRADHEGLPSHSLEAHIFM